MSSLLPQPYGIGNRKNTEKKEYVWKNMVRIEYRTVACKSEDESIYIENKLKNDNSYIFGT